MDNSGEDLNGRVHIFKQNFVLIDFLVKILIVPLPIYFRIKSILELFVQCTIFKLFAILRASEFPNKGSIVKRFDLTVIKLALCAPVIYHFENTV